MRLACGYEMRHRLSRERITELFAMTRGSLLRQALQQSGLGRLATVTVAALREISTRFPALRLPYSVLK